MKKILLSAVAVMAFGFANAQDTATQGFSKGDLFISGSLGFTSSKQGEAKTTSVEFSPIVAYFITENIALGGQLSVGSGKAEIGDAENKTNTFGISAIGRYYFTPAKSFSIFGQAQVGYSTLKQEPEVGAESKFNTFAIGVGPGMSYFVSNNFAIEAGLGLLNYSSTKEDTDGGIDADARNTFNLNLDLTNVNIGVVYKF